MTAKKLAEHLGNIDQRLIRGAEQTPDYGRRRSMGHIRRTLALAAAVCCAIAFWDKIGEACGCVGGKLRKSHCGNSEYDDYVDWDEE